MTTAIIPLRVKRPPIVREQNIIEGWKILTLERPPSPELTGLQNILDSQERYYDTLQAQVRFNDKSMPWQRRHLIRSENWFAGIGEPDFDFPPRRRPRLYSPTVQPMEAPWVRLTPLSSIARSRRSLSLPCSSD